MSQTQAQIAHQQKIQLAKGKLEEHDGKMIREDKIQEWALLEIAEMLYSIQFQMAQIQANVYALNMKTK